jgi:uncharacterized membrane protein
MSCLKRSPTCAAMRSKSICRQNRAMPLGNQTGMTEEERDVLGRWVNDLK